MNGLALCPGCNRQKGSQVQSSDTISTTTPVALRNWQREVLGLLADRPTRFLIAATPGGGKTLPALLHAQRLLEAGEIDRIVVLAPTRSLTDQWATAAHCLGLVLDPDNPAVEAKDIDGVALTYSALAHSAEHQRTLAARTATLFIADEVHHLGEERSHGDAFRHATQAGQEFLLLSGTPFRSDSNRIPHITYDEDGVSVPDFTYSYADAVADGVCRRIVFEEWDGTFSWLSAQGTMEATFGDDLDPTDSGRRLRTALKPDLAGLRAMLAAADEKLTRARLRHDDAGGLVIAISIEHAEAIARVLAEIVGEEPVVVTSADRDANDLIEQFAAGRQRWLVAVNMVSEGVDVPRLRVGAYATNVTTPMRFRQIVGRFVRTGSGPLDEPSFLFLPADPRLVAEAERISEEIMHTVEGDEEPEPPSAEPGPAADTGSFAPLQAEMEAIGAHADGVAFKDSSEAAAIVTLAKIHGVSVREVVARFPETGARSTDAEPLSKPATPRHVEARAMKRERRRLAGRLFHRLRESLGAGVIDYAAINGWANSAAGVGDGSDPTLDQRREINRLLIEEADRVGRGELTRIPH